MMLRKLLLPLLFFLAACAPAQPAARPTPVRVTPLPQPTMTPTSNSGVPLIIGPSEEAPTGAVVPIPDLTWEPSADAVLISGTFCCGFTTPNFVRNYIPEFQVRGDGTYTWVVQDAEGAREVFRTELTRDQVAALLDRIAAAGFFGWKDRYANNFVADVADQCIAVTLPGVEKQVCEYYEGAPEEFHNLFEYLAAGAGVTGRPYVPDTVYLQAEVFDVDFVSPNLVWNGDPLFSSLPAGGAWLSGDAVEPLWKTLNKTPWGPVVEENGTYYIYTLQVESLSPDAPPAR